MVALWPRASVTGMNQSTWALEPNKQAFDSELDLCVPVRHLAPYFIILCQICYAFEVQEFHPKKDNSEFKDLK